MNGGVSSTLSMAGEWLFRQDSERRGEAEEWFRPTTALGPWRPISVPGAWEEAGLPKSFTGPAWYRHTVNVPSDWQGRRVSIQFGGVSYATRVWANGRFHGEHVGMWDSFGLDVTDAIDAHGRLAFAVEVEKPGSRWPLGGALAGFYPYVSHTFGGIWRPVFLEATGPVRIADAYARYVPDTSVEVDVTIDSSGWASGCRVVVELIDPAHRTVATEEARGTIAAGEAAEFRIRLNVPRPVLWSPENPARYVARCTAYAGTEPSHVVEQRIGLRTVAVHGDGLYLNGAPVYPRGVLNWGWYPPKQSPDAGELFLTEEVQRLRDLGFNTMKQCLWVPPEHHFQVADDSGMLVWMELPLWAPDLSGDARARIPGEYERIVRQLRRHPSVVIWTLGCELNRGVDSDFLGDLYTRVKSLTGSPLVCDNSGSWEFYGGDAHEHADFYDTHFYTELGFFRPMVRSALPGWRRRTPWLNGEYCDSDTFRDLAAISDAGSGDPWWSTADPDANPQGVRWEYSVVEHRERLAHAGLTARRDELNEGSRRQALLLRKQILEWTRATPEMSGYVITGLRDTPIATAGIFDDLGRAKWSPQEFSPFNGDTVLFVEWNRRRDWVNGGDRPAYVDGHNYWAGQPIHARIGASHYGRETGVPTVSWALLGPDGTPVAESVGPTGSPVDVLAAPIGGFGGPTGAADDVIEPGQVRQIGAVETAAPDVTAPVKLSLRASLRIGSTEATNEWPIWVYPRDAVDGLPEPIAAWDPGEYLAGAERHRISLLPLTAGPGGMAFEWNGTNRRMPDARIVVATAWTPELLEYVRNGGRAVAVVLDNSAVVPTVGVPFWREAMKLFEPHPLWERFPNERFTDLQFYGLACDRALDPEPLARMLGDDARIRPVLRRVDARSLQVTDYLVDASLGAGRIFITTLRIPGGLGDTVSGLGRHVAGAYLLACMVRELSGS